MIMGNEAKLYVHSPLWDEWNATTRKTARLMWKYRDNSKELKTKPKDLAEAITAARHRKKVRQ